MALLELGEPVHFCHHLAPLVLRMACENCLRKEGRREGRAKGEREEKQEEGREGRKEERKEGGKNPTPERAACPLK